MESSASGCWRLVLLCVLVLAMVPVKAQNQVCTNAIIDLTIVLDGSGSVCDSDPLGRQTRGLRGCNNWDYIVAFAIAIIRQVKVLDRGSRVAMVKFGSVPSTEIYFDQFGDTEALVRWVERNMYYPDGNSATEAAILEVMDNVLKPERGERPDIPNVVIIVTDKAPNLPEPPSLARTRALEAAFRLKGDATIIPVGVNDVDLDFLSQLSSGGTYMEDYMQVSSFANLNSVLANTVNAACFMGARTSPGPSPNCRDTNIDLTFVIDGSGSICDPSPRDIVGLKGCPNWNRMTIFVSQFVQMLGISDEGNRAAIVLFSHTAKTAVYLNDYKDSSSLSSWILQKMIYPDGPTNTEAGLRQVLRDVLTPGRGDRRELNNVVILITDGNATIPAPPSYARNAALSAASQLKVDAKIFCVGITDNVDADFLRDVSTGGRQNIDYFLSPSFDDLNTIRNQVVSQTCYIPTTTTPLTSTRPFVYPPTTAGPIFDPVPVVELQPSAVFVTRGHPEIAMCTVYNTQNLPYSWKGIRWYDPQGNLISTKSDKYMIEIGYMDMEESTSYWVSSLYVAPTVYTLSGNYTCEVNYNGQVVRRQTHILIKGCGVGEFMCPNDHACIPCEKVCDGRRDCYDNSDEFECYNGKDPRKNSLTCDTSKTP